jgi:hypothetical protein
MKQKRIIVLGFMAECPIAGVIWQHIHYIVGLQRLGHEVYYVEDTCRYPYNPIALGASADLSYPTNTLDRLAKKYGFEGRWAYQARYKEPFKLTGMDRAKLLNVYKEADCALNICGSHPINEELASINHLIYVESDPGVEQIRIATGDQRKLKLLRTHRHLFTFGENIGTPAFMVPLKKFCWRPTRQPVVTDLWCSTQAAPAPNTGAIMTTICNWSTAGRNDIEWEGSTYLWSKSQEFVRFIEAPIRCGEVFELAANMSSEGERALFLKNNWKLTSPYELSIDWSRYRDYIRSSKGEFTCAKDQYVRLNTGWFSDRSACYLAAGRPVITQETGFTKHFGGRNGLLSFSTMNEVAEAAAEIRRDYQRHSNAALAIAREVFEAEKVLRSLLDRAGI